jgi:hypothetical protein
MIPVAEVVHAPMAHVLYIGKSGGQPIRNHFLSIFALIASGIIIIIISI